MGPRKRVDISVHTGVFSPFLCVCVLLKAESHMLDDPHKELLLLLGGFNLKNENRVGGRNFLSSSFFPFSKHTPSDFHPIQSCSV